MSTTLEALNTSLLLLLYVISGDKRDRSAIGCLHVDFCRKSALICDLQVLSVLLAKDDVPEVDLGLLDFDKSFLACANERNVNATSLRQDREDRIDVLVELRGKSDGDSRGETCGHAA